MCAIYVFFLHNLLAQKIILTSEEIFNFSKGVEVCAIVLKQLVGTELLFWTCVFLFNFFPFPFLSLSISYMLTHIYMHTEIVRLKPVCQGGFSIHTCTRTCCCITQHFDVFFVIWTSASPYFLLCLGRRLFHKIQNQ